MKIAIFTETYLPDINGVVTHIKILKEGLEKNGHEVLIVTADKNTKHYFFEDGILHCPAIEAKKIYNYGLASPVSVERLRLIKKYNPDIIHIHNEFGVGFSGAVISGILKKPLVYTLHTMYDDYIYYIAKKPFVPIMKKATRTYARFLARKSTALTGPSKKVEEFFREAGVKKDVSVIPNPVEFEEFNPKKITDEQVLKFREKFRINENTKIACFCGRLGKEKNVETLINIWKDAITPEDNIKLLIFGDGPVKDELERQAIELGIDNMVTFCGKVAHNDLPAYYASCDIYVTASLSDTDSISMLEGMSMGLPVLQLYDELNKEQIEEGITGYMYKNADDFRQKMLLLKNMPADDVKSFRQNVRLSVAKAKAEQFSKYLIEIYEDVIKKGNK